MSTKNFSPIEQTAAIDYRTLSISSPAFNYGATIPLRYTCDGAFINPPLDVACVPKEAMSLAIIVDDPDAPIGTWSHWLVWNIPVTKKIRENHPHGDTGKNDFLENKYDGPCPHAGSHRYRFKVYALDTILDLSSHTRQWALEKAMSGHILAFGEWMGTYERISK